MVGEPARRRLRRQNDRAGADRGDALDGVRREQTMTADGARGRGAHGNEGRGAPEVERRVAACSPLSRLHVAVLAFTSPCSEGVPCPLLMSTAEPPDPYADQQIGHEAKRRRAAEARAWTNGELRVLRMLALNSCPPARATREH